MRRWPWSVWFVLLAVTACSSPQAQMPDVDTAPPLPEVRKITFIGNHTFSARSLRGAMASVQRPWFPPWKRGEEYNRSTLGADLKRLQRFYFHRGFLQAAARVERVDRDPEKNTVQITIAIDEGSPTLVRDIRLAGQRPDELSPEQTLLQKLPLRSGDRITKQAFDDSKAQLLQQLQDASYARAQVISRTEVNTEQYEAIVTFTLQPSQRTHFGQVTIRGNSQVKTRAIERQLRIREGELYSQKRLTKATNAIYGLGMFRAVRPIETNIKEAGMPLNIEFEVRERQPRTLEFSFGVSSVQRFRLRAAWTQRNVFGEAERLTLEGRLASFVQEANASLHFPYFLFRRTRFTQTFFVRNEGEIDTDPLGLLETLFTIENPHPDYDLLSVGSISRVDHQLSETLEVAGGLDLSFSHFYNVSMESEADTEDNILLIQFAELTWDTSDDILNPTRGMLLRGRVDHSSASFVSDVSFVKLVFEGRHYQPIWWRMILATRLVLGSIQPYGESDDVPRNVRFVAGGPGSVRGFAINRLGPLDANNDPIGGNSLIEGSLELRFPIAGKLGGAFFVDFGNVFRNSFTYRLDELRYAVGPGIRYLTPIGPVRFDIGIIIDRRDDEDFGRVEFSIGQAF